MKNPIIFRKTFSHCRFLVALASLFSVHSLFAQNNTYTETVNGVSFTMVRVQGGTFTMGCTAEQGADCKSNESPLHQVTLSDYAIGETEVTQALWYAVMDDIPPTNQDCPSCPIDNFTWSRLQRFIQNLNAITGKSYRLPTEAEWEFAARGGQKGAGWRFSGGNNLIELAWMENNAGGKKHPVKGKKPNELGLYDMSGNVWEWCSDWYGEYPKDGQTNPTGPSTGSYRVMRGGDFRSDRPYCRLTVRDYGIPDGSIGVGFRIAAQ